MPVMPFVLKHKWHHGHCNVVHNAICIETQNMPDAIHLEENPSTILKAGDTYDEKTSYKFEVIKNL